MNKQKYELVIRQDNDNNNIYKVINTETREQFGNDISSLTKIGTYINKVKVLNDLVEIEKEQECNTYQIRFTRLDHEELVEMVETQAERITELIELVNDLIKQ